VTVLPLDAEHTLRTVRAGDGAALARAYRSNREHLAPWEPRRSEGFFTEAWQEQNVKDCVTDAAAGRSIRFVIVTVDDEIVGRVNINNIVRGAFLSADLGYWVDHRLQGRGIASRAVAQIIDHARTELGLHRLQAATLPRNAASQAVLAHNGFEHIGLAPRYLRIAGEWQDHVMFQRLLDSPLTEPAARP